VHELARISQEVTLRDPVRLAGEGQYRLRHRSGALALTHAGALRFAACRVGGSTTRGRVGAEDADRLERRLVVETLVLARHRQLLLVYRSGRDGAARTRSARLPPAIQTDVPSG